MRNVSGAEAAHTPAALDTKHVKNVALPTTQQVHLIKTINSIHIPAGISPFRCATPQ